MLYWIIYDISNNGVRSKVASKCKDYGFVRVQKSAFLGELTKNRAEMLAMEIKAMLKGGSDCVFVFPSCESCFGGKMIEGRFDEEKVKDRDYLVIGGGHGKAIPDGN